MPLHRADIAHQLPLGEPALDEEHLMLLQLVERLRSSPTEAWITCLDELAQHARRHFEQEDIDLRAIGGEAIQCHLDEHAAVMQSLADVRQALEQAKPIGPQELDMIDRLVEEFFRWLPEHVQVMDATVAHYRSKRRLGGAPILIKKKI